jgi:YfiH family protein
VASVPGFFTDRSGGVSLPPYDSLNPADHVDDEPAAVARNRALLAERAGRPIQWQHAVHGAEVAVIGEPGDSEAAGGYGLEPYRVVPDPYVDAMVTTRRDVALGLVAGDCVMALLFGSPAVDPAGGTADPCVVGVAHAGRIGMSLGIIGNVVEVMRKAGADRFRVWVGPSICGACYEVPPDMQEQVAAAVPASRCRTRQGTTGIDVAAGVRSQLEACGIDDVTVDRRCTAEDPALFSYRRDRRTGRIAGVAWLP